MGASRRLWSSNGKGAAARVPPLLTNFRGLFCCLPPENIYNTAFTCSINRESAMIARVHFCAVVLALLTSAAFSSTTETTVFDKGTDSPDEGNYKYKTISEQRAAAKKRHDAEMKKQAASIAYHIKTLKNPKADENDRATSAEYLGVLARTLRCRT